MATFLFNEIVFGPVRSRRLGVSLGINLLPTSSKICNFDCIYCECGWTNSDGSKELPSRSEIRVMLEARMVEMLNNDEPLDVITFAGNGEPTIHPDFEGIIADTIEVRNRIFPKAKIAVLSNSTMLHKPTIVEALKRVDQNILKLDSAFDETLQLLNQPKKRLTVREVVEHLKQFDGSFILQTLFVRGSYNGKPVDNASGSEIERWLEVVKEVRPKEVMVYTIARDTPIETLSKVPLSELNRIADRIKELGIPVQVSG